MDGWLRPVALPRAEPISVAEAKDHVRQPHDAEDVYIGVLVSAARQHIERITGRSLVLQTWDYALDTFPGGHALQLPTAPVQAVSSITYYDDDLSTETVLDSSRYQTDTLKEPARVALKAGEVWPSDQLRQSSGVVVRLKAGYEVPFTVDAEANELAAIDHWFSAGDTVRLRVSGGEAGKLPGGLSANADYFVINPSGGTLQLSASEGGAPVDLTATEGIGTFFVGHQPVPAALRQYMLLLIGAMYEHREIEVTGTISTQMKFASGLLAPYRLWARG